MGSIFESMPQAPVGGRGRGQSAWARASVSSSAMLRGSVALLSSGAGMGGGGAALLERPEQGLDELATGWVFRRAPGKMAMMGGSAWEMRFYVLQREARFAPFFLFGYKEASLSGKVSKEAVPIVKVPLSGARIERVVDPKRTWFSFTVHTADRAKFPLRVNKEVDGLRWLEALQSAADKS